jgi:DNA-binding Lrp family transcriptional regulator
LTSSALEILASAHDRDHGLLARASAEVVECHRITGEDCFFMKAHVRSIEHLEELIDRFSPMGRRRR